MRYGRILRPPKHKDEGPQWRGKVTVKVHMTKECRDLFFERSRFCQAVGCGKESPYNSLFCRQHQIGWFSDAAEAEGQSVAGSEGKSAPDDRS